MKTFTVGLVGLFVVATTPAVSTAADSLAGKICRGTMDTGGAGSMAKAAVHLQFFEADALKVNVRIKASSPRSSATIRGHLYRKGQHVRRGNSTETGEAGSHQADTVKICRGRPDA